MMQDAKTVAAMTNMRIAFEMLRTGRSQMMDVALRATKARGGGHDEKKHGDRMASNSSLDLKSQKGESALLGRGVGRHGSYGSQSAAYSHDRRAMER
jgi:hypothetical protein